MTTKDTGGSAFPRIDRIEPGEYGDHSVVSTGGMTLRDWFAGKAMQGMFANGELTERSDWNPRTAAVAAYAIADAMLAARKEES